MYRAPFPSPAVAVMVALPLAMALTKPNLFTVATLLFEDDHVTVCNVVLEGVNDVVKKLSSPGVKDIELGVTLILVALVTVLSE